MRSRMSSPRCRPVGVFEWRRVRMLFVGDDWAEAHHDIEIVDEAGRGWCGAGCQKASRVSAGCMR